MRSALCSADYRPRLGVGSFRDRNKPSAGESGDEALGERNIVGEGNRLLLHDADLVAVLGQTVVDALPAGAVGESAVHQYDVLDALRRLGLGGISGGGHGQSGGRGEGESREFHGSLLE